MDTYDQRGGMALKSACLLQTFIHAAFLLLSVYMLIYKKFFTFSVALPLNIKLSLGTDHLTVFFFLLISILGLCVSLYSRGYLRPYQTEKHFNAFLILYNLFGISLYFVVMARDIFGFLLFWELMSLTSYFLVIFEGHKDEILKSGLMYFVMTHIGTVFIILAFFMLYKHTGDIYLSRVNMAALSRGEILTALLSAFIGFGTKAGLVPLHVWLPKAYPSAPSNIASFMSGVMTKLGIYGIIRFAFYYYPQYPLSFGFILLAAGCISAVIGITHGLVQSDIKRFLAYTSIENIGIITLALGVSYISLSLGDRVVGALAFTAALIHILNHGIFKGLLFMGAGNILRSTKTTNMEVLGGLIKKMPKTSAFFFIGALSACGLPPLNGFVGEWLLYKGIIKAGADIGSTLYSVPVVVSGIALAFTGALAAYGFVKTLGITFLGLPRSEEAEKAKELPCLMVFPIGALSVLCLFIGVYPNFIVTFANQVTDSALFTHSVSQSAFTISAVGGNLSMVVLAAFALIFGLLVFGFMGYKAQRFGTRFYGTWDCGFDGLTSRMQFSGQGFIKTVNRLLSGTFVVNKRIRYTKGDLTSEGIRFDIHFDDNVEKSIYTPIKELVRIMTSRAQKLQQGFIQIYLAYVFVALILLMVFYL